MKLPLLLLMLSCLLTPAARAATYVVTKTADSDDGTCDADCSLREAINAANSGGSTVQVAAGLYRLAIPRLPRGDNEPGDGSNGNLVVKTAMTITGAGNDVTIIDARPSVESSGIDRVFSITQAGNLTLSGVTISGGLATGFGQGGGILSLGGSASLTDVVVLHNTGIFGGGGIAISSASNPPGKLTLSRCEIAENTGGLAIGGGQGGGILNIQSSVDIFDSTIRNNAALNSTGGGIMNIDNQSRPSPPAALRVIRSTLVGNIAGDPGRTSINEGVGGGIYNNGGRLTVTNSTITGNEATPAFSQPLVAIPGTGRGGGVAHQLLLGDDPNDGTSIVNSTIAYNLGLAGSQLYGSATVAPMRVANTLVARDGVFANCASPSGENGIDSFGGNISSDASCVFDDPRDQVDVAPGIDTLLADNGGPTETLALFEGSVAIGKGRFESCPAIDQRGFTRKEDCDVGAFELDAPEADAAAMGLAALAGLVATRRFGRR